MLKKLALLLCLILLAVAPFNFAAAEDARVNVIGLAGTTGLSLVKLFADRPALAKGLTAEYSVVKSPDQITAKIVTGEAGIAALPTNMAAILVNKGVPIKLLAITNWGVTYLVGRDASVRRWADLRGKQVAVTGKGAPPDILFRYFLRRSGVDPDKDVTIKYYPNATELALLVGAGQIDLAVLPEPWVTEAIQRNTAAKILLDFQTEWKRIEKTTESYPQSCLVVSAKLAQERPDFINAFLAKAAASSSWVNRFPTRAGEYAEKYVEISAKAAKAAIPRCNLRFKTAAQSRTAVNDYLNKLFTIDPQTIGGKVPDGSFYYQ